MERLQKQFCRRVFFRGFAKTANWQNILDNLFLFNYDVAKLGKNEG